MACQARCRRWQDKLHRYGVWRGRNLVPAAASDDRSPTARELRRSVRRTKRRFENWSGTYEGRATIHRFKVRRIPSWGRSQLRSIAWCESRNNPRAIGGGGAYRGLYQFQLQHLARRGRIGRPRRRAALRAGLASLAAPGEPRQRPLAHLRLERRAAGELSIGARPPPFPSLP